MLGKIFKIALHVHVNAIAASTKQLAVIVSATFVTDEKFASFSQRLKLWLKDSLQLSI